MAFAEVAADLRERGLIRAWRDELLAVTTRFDQQPPALLVERGCIPLLGCKGYGVALNAWSRDPVTGSPEMWVAKRAASKATWPGMLDAMAAGAISAGLSPLAAVRKEAAEEAGLPDALSLAARPAGAVSYKGVDEWGQLKRDVFFVFDVELPWDFAPVAVDGEVQEFSRMSMDRVASAVARGDPGRFKPNVQLVVIDFLVRHGHIPPEAPGYLPLIASLRQGDCR